MLKCSLGLAPAAEYGFQELKLEGAMEITAWNARHWANVWSGSALKSSMQDLAPELLNSTCPNPVCAAGPHAIDV